MNNCFYKRYLLVNGYQDFMNESGKIFFVVLLVVFAGYTSFASTGSQLNDTLRTKVNKIESNGDPGDQNSKKNDNVQSFKDNNNAKSQLIKQVKSARPDMSKARGARPPIIVRPTGSRIPNGIGKPAGAARPGHG
jgi:hypothetical protein